MGSVIIKFDYTSTHRRTINYTDIIFPQHMIEALLYKVDVLIGRGSYAVPRFNYLLLLLRRNVAVVGGIADDPTAAEHVTRRSCADMANNNIGGGRRSKRRSCRRRHKKGRPHS
jgi:hypothetical protein